MTATATPLLDAGIALAERTDRGAIQRLVFGRDSDGEASGERPPR